MSLQLHRSNTLSDKNLSFFGARFGNRQALIKRFPSYEDTIKALKDAFKTLESTPTERIILSTYVKELDGTFEVPEHIWAEVLPRIKRVTVTLLPQNSINPPAKRPRLGLAFSDSD
ncbi:hypothetical protein FS749_004097 [Ceratobasidium sp. UAMH 11750]|nr:hypothetical protein FS749_004097 [Ceratobasidium sp. UAMH 11750]